MGKKWKQRQTLFFWAPKSLWMVTAAMKFIEHIFIEHLLCTPATDSDAGGTNTAEEKTDKNLSPYRAPEAYIPVKLRQEN